MNKKEEEMFRRWMITQGNHYAGIAHGSEYGGRRVKSMSPYELAAVIGHQMSMTSRIDQEATKVLVAGRGAMDALQALLDAIPAWMLHRFIPARRLQRSVASARTAHAEAACVLFPKPVAPTMDAPSSERPASEGAA